MESLILYLWGLAIVAVAAWLVAWPFFGTRSPEALAGPADPPGAPWRRRRDEALAGIRDADFDFQLGKLTEADHRDLRRKLEQSALEAIDELDRGDRK